MRTVISSTFSVAMLVGAGSINYREISVEEFAEGAKIADINVCNPRHESTCALVAQVSSVPPVGGFLKIMEPTNVYVILPGRDLQTRAGTEISLSDFDSCQFFLLEIRPS